MRFNLFPTHILSFSLGALLLGKLSAYPFDTSLADLPETYSITGIETRTNGTVENYNIPVSDWPDEISFSIIRGGDGGRAKANADIGQDVSAEGGGGALIVASFEIHPTDADALRPGGEVRFVLGSKADDHTRSDSSAAGGGGGTAVLYRNPVDGAEWELLAIAGGGGGGSASAAAFDTYTKTGRNANTGTSGDSGGDDGLSTSGLDGGTNGGAGGGFNDESGGGGGVNQSASFDHGGKIEDFIGGDGGENGGGSSFGGFGYAGGGGGYADEGSGWGGGGGGYSGGGAGGSDGQGGGAGSFLDDRATNGTITSRNSSKSNGAVAFTATLNNSNGSIAGPTISLTGGSSITISVGDSYSEPGVTAQDLYGNEVSDIIPIEPAGLILGEVGTHTITYRATDQFGTQGTGERTVTITSHKPTFNLVGDITVNEDSGSYTQNNFVYNFDSNDSGQSLDSYQVTNNNTSIFSSQPTVNNSGRLTFTPASDTSGTATVTVIAIDNPDDATNGSSDPQTFSITVLSVDDPPTNVALSNTSVVENSTSVGLVTATDPLNSILTFSLDGGDDDNLFSLAPDTGALTFQNAPDYDIPGDDNEDNTYEIKVLVSGGDGSTTQDFQIQVTDLNETPSIPAISNMSIDENTTSVGVLSSTDPEEDTVSFVISGGADSEFFEIINGDTLVFLEGQDFENPADNNDGNNYNVRITASDGTNTSDYVRLTIQVQDVNESPTAILVNNSPTATELTVSEDANGGQTLATLGALDDDSGDTFTFSLTSDAGGLFDISGTNLILADSATLDHETNESHSIEIEVRDSADNALTKSFTILVSDVTETPIQEFRSSNGLAADGSSDTEDWSENGLSNILYYAFGLGDPNGSDIDWTRISSSSKDAVGLKFQYTRPLGPDTGVRVNVCVSDDLSTWHLLNELPREQQATSVDMLDLGDGYQSVTLTFPAEGANRFYKLQVSVESGPPAP